MELKAGSPQGFSTGH